MKRSGPNDAKHVVWAISKCFLLLFVFFTSTNHLSHFYRVLLKLLSYAEGMDKYLFIFIFILIFIDIFIGV